MADGFQKFDTVVLDVGYFLKELWGEPGLLTIVQSIGLIDPEVKEKSENQIVMNLWSYKNTKNDEDFINHFMMKMEIRNITDRDKLKRFLSYIWRKYLVRVDLGKIEPNLVLYNEIFADIKKLAVDKNFETWPYLPEEVMEEN